MTVEAFAVSTGVVALGEMGDKTQLLALMLAARYRAPRPIIAGIFVATLANHAVAAALGAWLARLVDPQWMRWLLGASFIAVALWMLVPDSAPDDDEPHGPGKLGVFGLTVLAFFLVEMGDKTQIATVAMAAHYADPIWVVVGTTAGMLLADVPAVFVGDRLAARIPMRLVHGLAAAVFALLGVATLLGAGSALGL